MAMPGFFYMDFAYTRAMEVILFLMVNAANFIYAYIVVSVFLALFAVQISRARMLFFAFLLVAFQVLTIYVPYALNGFRGFGVYEYLLATPNPIVYLIQYFIVNRMFKISKHRMINMMFCIYLFSLLILCLSRIVNFAFFQQSSARYNYMIDAGSAVVGAAVNVALYRILIRFFRKKSVVVKMTDNVFPGSIVKTVMVLFGIMVLAYAGVSAAQVHYENDALAMLLVTNIIVLAIVVAIQRLKLNADEINLQNNAAHINTLNSVITGFRAVKHDFYNILGTYSGYITLDDLKGLKQYHEKLTSTTITTGDQLDIAKKMDQNPALCALLIQKGERAEKLGVTMNVALHCPIDGMAIDNFDLCRVLGNLLDNAIEAASETQTRSVSFSIEEKQFGDKLIVITNAAKENIDVSRITELGYTTKAEHSGIGLAQVRDIISRYQNCALNFVCYGLQFSAFIEIRGNG